MEPLGFTEKDISIVRDILLSGKTHQECLEWGAGRSTVLFPTWMRSTGKQFRYISIEHDPEWHKTVTTHVQTAGLLNVDVRLFACSGDPRVEPMDDYVNHPFTIGKRFDFVFIDGRKRVRCLHVAARLLAPNGVVVLHDAERERYWSAFDHFNSHQRIGDKLWMGRIDI